MNIFRGRGSLSDADRFRRDFREIFCQEGISAAGISAATQAGACELSIRKVEGRLPNGEEYSAYVLGDHVHKPRSKVQAYWVPQGQFVDIPETPGQNDPKFVFTPSFSGCTWVMDRLPEGRIRVHHVEGGRFEEQYSSGALQLGNFSTLSATRWRDYANPDRDGNLTRKASMFMAHEEGQGWVQYWQTREYTVGQRGDFAVGPNGKVQGHDYCVLTHQERVNGLLTTMAASHSEQCRHGQPTIQSSRSEFPVRDLRLPDLNPSQSAPSQDRTTEVHHDGNLHGGGARAYRSDSISSSNSSDVGHAADAYMARYLRGSEGAARLDESRYQPVARRGSTSSVSSTASSSSSESTSAARNERVEAYIRSQRGGGGRSR
jgi:hypothetical protein